jgi:DNA ligase-1
LRDYLGDEFETWRVGREGNSPGKVEKTTAPKLLLAHKWDEFQDMTNWWMSEKLDGVRAYWNGKKFISRLGNYFYAPDWFAAELPSDVCLDGELFGGRGKFQTTVSIVKSQDQGERWKTLTYKIFDAPGMDKPFEERVSALKKLFDPSNKKKHPHMEVIEHIKCRDNDHMLEYLNEVQAKKGEGVMMRQPKSKYVGSRSNTLLKVKTFFDDEAKVLGHLPGKGKHKGLMGALLVEMPNKKTFQVGSGFTDAQRAKPPPIGSIISYKYQELTDGGIPRFPTYLGIRIDAEWPPKKKNDK